jgi:hypothetical protein
MHLVHGLIFLSAAYPLSLAWAANRRTTLLHAVAWAFAAWVAWLGAAAFAGAAVGTAQRETARYLALALTGCAGVAVLGARRPGVGAWNFVLLGLLAVMLLPLAEGLLLGGRPLDTLRLVFLGATLAVGVLNYLPTRLALGALLLALGGGWEVAALAGGVASPPGGDVEPGWLCVGLAPWGTLLGVRRRAARSDFDLLWLEFRDRFGLVWGQRVREQFNNAAAHAGWPVTLYWQGLVLAPGAARPEPAARAEMTATLRALLNRFGPDEGAAPPRSEGGG